MTAPLTPRSTRDGISHRLVFAVLGGSVLLVFALSLYVYQRHIRYVPRATRHMPEDFSLALRVDVEEGVVYEPFRRHFLPLLEAGRSGEAKEVSRLEGLRRRTTIELGVDLRELGVALDREGSWLVLLGGHFPRDGVVLGVERLLSDEGIAVRRLPGPERLLHPSGVAFGVSSDGVLVLAQSDEVLLRALRQNASRPELAADTALSLVFGRDPGLLSTARLQVRAGQTFEAKLLLPQAPKDFGEPQLAALTSGKTGDFKLLSVVGSWRLSPESARGEHAQAVLSRSEFDHLVGSLADGLAVLMGLDAAKTPNDAP